MTRALAVWVMAIALATGADPPATGTDPGQVLPGPFSAYVVAGVPKAEPPKSEPVQTKERQNFGDPSRIGKHSDLVTRFGLDPTVAVFTREAPTDEGAIGKLIKQLDSDVAKYKNSRLHAFTVFLRLKDEFLKDDDRIPQARAIEQFASKSEIKNTPLALDQNESDRSRTWKINNDDQTVVIIYENHKVKAKFTYTTEKPFDDAAVAAIQAEIEKSIKKN